MTSGPVSRAQIPKEIWVLVAAALLIALGFGLVAPVLPQYAASFDVGVAAASAIVTVFAVTRLAFAPATGPLMARFGDDEALCLHLLDHGVAVVAASAFGGKDGFRISFAADAARLTEALSRIAKAVA